MSADRRVDPAEQPFAPRVTNLPGGRILTVRPIRPTDVAGVQQLYHDLSLDDRYRRFFSAFHPSDEFVTRWCSAAEHGGFGLVALVSDDAGERLVGEAGYLPLPDGDGELAITIASSWRGWLGPYLLDALLEAAAARGIQNLEADVLLENRPMLTLVRSRGYATLAHDDFTVVRAVVATEGRVPSWPPAAGHPRVLVEVPGGRWAATAAATAAGFTVMACPGPGVVRCPVLRGETCPLAAGADAVVVALRPSDPRSAAIIAAHPARHPDAVLVVVQPPEGDTLPLPCGSCSVPAGTPVAALVARLAALVPVTPEAQDAAAGTSGTATASACAAADEPDRDRLAR
jgi:GNAT superfamily N-acetyltransferase